MSSVEPNKSRNEISIIDAMFIDFIWPRTVRDFELDEEHKRKLFSRKVYWRLILRKLKVILVWLQMFDIVSRCFVGYEGEREHQFSSGEWRRLYAINVSTFFPSWNVITNTMG